VALLLANLARGIAQAALVSETDKRELDRLHSRSSVYDALVFREAGLLTTPDRIRWAVSRIMESDSQNLMRALVMYLSTPVLARSGAKMTTALRVMFPGISPEQASLLSRTIMTEQNDPKSSLVSTMDDVASRLAHLGDSRLLRDVTFVCKLLVSSYDFCTEFANKFIYTFASVEASSTMTSHVIRKISDICIPGRFSDGGVFPMFSRAKTDDGIAVVVQFMTALMWYGDDIPVKTWIAVISDAYATTGNPKLITGAILSLMREQNIALAHKYELLTAFLTGANMYLDPECYNTEYEIIRRMDLTRERSRASFREVVEFPQNRMRNAYGFWVGEIAEIEAVMRSQQEHPAEWIEFQRHGDYEGDLPFGLTLRGRVGKYL
jgi:hypothetical protein